MRFDVYCNDETKYLKSFIIDADNKDIARGIASERYGIPASELTAVPQIEEIGCTDRLDKVLLADQLQKTLDKVRLEHRKAYLDNRLDDMLQLAKMFEHIQAGAILGYALVNQLDATYRRQNKEKFERRVWKPEEYTRLEETA